MPAGPADTTAVGSRSVSLQGADVAGNTHGESCGYRVEYDFVGWQPPVADEPAVNVVAAGQIVPLKWRLLDAAGAPVTTLSAAAVTSAAHACDAGVPGDPVDEVAVGASGLQNLGDGYYQYNWRTPRTYAGTCRTLRLDLAEGELHTAEFRFSG